MIEIALAFALGVIVAVLCLHCYRFPMLVIGSVFIGIAFSVCVVFVCIPGMMAALEAYQSENPDVLHAYAMIVGSFGLTGVVYYFWDSYRKESGSQDAGASIHHARPGSPLRREAAWPFPSRGALGRWHI
jgi:hypothetical protein